MRQAVVAAADPWRAAGGHWCRVCSEPVAVIANSVTRLHLGKAFHTVTGLETGPDGHPDAERGERP